MVEILNAKKEKDTNKQKKSFYQTKNHENAAMYNTLDDNYFHGTNIIMMAECQH